MCTFDKDFKKSYNKVRKKLYSNKFIVMQKIVLEKI